MFIVLIEPVSETLRSPIATFVLLLFVALVVPPVFERLRLPGLVGLLVAGVLLGGSGLGWLSRESETVHLLSEIGKIYLMFVAGLEIDLILFQETKNRSLVFGSLTFALPFTGGLLLGLFFGFGWLAAVLIGSLLASHTLLAYPIVQRLGIVSDEAVTVAVGATIVTDIAALVVLAVCLGISQGDFTSAKLLWLLGSLILYTLAVLIGLKRLAIAFFRATGKDEGNQFLFVLLSVFLSAVGAQLIGVEGIIGAFLAGLAINSVIGDGPVKEKTEFIGSVLFIPMFFINMGLLLNLEALSSLLQSIYLPLLIVGMLLLTKLLAALVSKQLFRYSWPQTWMMWSLSVPQVAATLAAALVGYEAGIIDVQVFNSVILLMLVTAVLGPLVTARMARKLAMEAASAHVAPLSWLPEPARSAEAAQPAHLDHSDHAYTDHAYTDHPYTVVVPVYNPRTEFYLLELAALIAQYERGQVVALSIAIARQPLDSSQVTKVIAHAQRRLDAAIALKPPLSVPLQTTLRIDYSVPSAICHLSRERQANLIVLGMSKPPALVGTALLETSLSKASALNTVHNAVLWSAHCPVIVARLLSSPTQMRNILFPLETPSPLTIRVLRLAQVIAAANRGEETDSAIGKVTLLHVHSPFSTQTYREKMRMQLQSLVTELPAANCQIEIVTVVKDHWISEVVQRAQAYDLVIVRSQRRRASSGLSLGVSTQPLLDRLTGSVLLVGEPSLSPGLRR